jgi:hypothetical protein
MPSRMCRTSLCCFAWGQCLASTARQWGSISQFQIVRPPVAHSSPSSRPPIPEKSEPIVVRSTDRYTSRSFCRSHDVATRCASGKNNEGAPT